jgi:LPS sulfotransferase NodH
MTREKVLQIDHLLCKIEAYEALIEEIYDMHALDEIRTAYGEDLEPELTAIVQAKLDILKKELEEM